MRKIIGGLNGIIALRLLAGGGRQEQYLLRDEFTDTLAAGAVHGTKATDGVNVRTVVDTESKASIASGKFVMSGKATPAFGDPMLLYPAQNKAPGLSLLMSVVPGIGFQYVGWDNDRVTTIYRYVTFQGGGIGANSLGNLLPYTPGLAYNIAYTLRSSGAFIFTKPPAGNWLLLWNDQGAMVSSLSPAAQSYSGDISLDSIRIPRTRWLPTPIASDGFSTWGATDGLGHAEGVAGGIGSGGGGKAWTAQLGTFGVSGGRALATALNGNSRAYATVDAGTPNVVAGVGLTRGTTVAGLALRYVDENNRIAAYHDGTNVALWKFVAGTGTSVIVAAVAYVAGARLQVIADGTSFQLFYNGAKVGSTSTISDAVLQTSTLHGILSNDLTSALDNFACWARGTEGQYNILNRWSN